MCVCVFLLPLLPSDRRKRRGGGSQRWRTMRCFTASVVAAAGEEELKINRASRRPCVSFSLHYYFHFLSFLLLSLLLNPVFKK